MIWLSPQYSPQTLQESCSARSNWHPFTLLTTWPLQSLRLWTTAFVCVSYLFKTRPRSTSSGEISLTFEMSLAAFPVYPLVLWGMCCHNHHHTCRGALSFWLNGGLLEGLEHVFPWVLCPVWSSDLGGRQSDLSLRISLLVDPFNCCFFSSC